MARPDFFIVGAPKCGTTALTDYLRGHPEVGRVLKEPHYFGSDLAVRRGVATEPEYLARFAGVAPGLRCGDASVFYLYSERAAAEIAAFAPEARIIVMLRNPADMLYSLHSQLVFIDSEQIGDFEAALAADEERRRGRLLPRHRVLAQSGYRPIARYTEQLRRYLEVFGPDRVLTIIFDDFARDPVQATREACAFLDLDPTFRPDARVVNPNKRARSRLVQRIVEHPPEPARRVVRTLTNQFVRKTLSSRVRRANTHYTPRPPLDPALRRRLNAEFAPEVAALSDLLGRDLTSWCADA